MIDIAIGDDAVALRRFAATLDRASSIGSEQWADRLSAWVDRGGAMDGDGASRTRLLARVGPAALPIERIGQRRALVSLAEVALRDEPGAVAGILGSRTPVAGWVAAEVELLRGEADRRLGRVAEADEALGRAEALARTVGPRHLVWRSAAARARLWHGRDRDQHALAIATARHELGVLADSAGAVDRATLLRSADARALLGSRAPSGATSRGLTGRERQVAEGVARGLRNKEIAEELGISSKTVEMHVANAIAKVQASSRSALAVWVATTSSADP